MMLPPMTMTGTRSHQALYIAIVACCRPTTPWQIMAIGFPSIFASPFALVRADFLVRAGEDLWLRIATMIEHGFVQSAETGRAIHRQIVDVERLEHVDHEISTTGRLTD